MGSDMSVRWLLEAFLNLNKNGKKLYIVPIVINYERIYEQENLSIEMISGQKKEYNFITALHKMITARQDSLGRVYVKYLNPIDL